MHLQHSISEGGFDLGGIEIAAQCERAPEVGTAHFAVQQLDVFRDVDLCSPFDRQVLAIDFDREAVLGLAAKWPDVALRWAVFRKPRDPALAFPLPRNLRGRTVRLLSHHLCSWPSESTDAVRRMGKISDTELSAG